jgi:hypothetical protein
LLAPLETAEEAQEEEVRGKGTDTASLKVDDGNCALVLVEEDGAALPMFECSCPDCADAPLGSAALEKPK